MLSFLLTLMLGLAQISLDQPQFCWGPILPADFLENIELYSPHLSLLLSMDHGYSWTLVLPPAIFWLLILLPLIFHILLTKKHITDIFPGVFVLFCLTGFHGWWLHLSGGCSRGAAWHPLLLSLSIVLTFILLLLKPLLLWLPLFYYIHCGCYH